jgi:nucleotide-binding universal stress UspA family protein
VNITRPRRSVVVGIDGSQAAIAAAEWAVDEAVSRDVPLRLIHVIPDQVEPGTSASADNKRLELEYGEAALRSASASVAATTQPVKVETVILRGSPVATLIAESRQADMVCVGSVGIGRFARGLLGSTAAELAESARCPVAIIRRKRQPEPDSGWIVVSVKGPSGKGSSDGDDVIAHAMEEAQRRHAPVLAVGALQGDGDDTPDELDRRVQAWSRHYPDVPIYPIAARTGIAEFLAGNEERVQLAVIGSSEAHHVAEFIGHTILGRPECSVLVVRS